MPDKKTVGRPPQMEGGKGRTVYLPAHVWEWLKANGASRKIVELVEEKMNCENKRCHECDGPDDGEMCGYECRECVKHTHEIVSAYLEGPEAVARAVERSIEHYESKHKVKLVQG